jgi:hypothetical protein
MKLETLKKFNHGSSGIAYTVTGLTDNQYKSIYLQACEKYNSVEQHVTMSYFNDEMYGYILCK